MPNLTLVSDRPLPAATAGPRTLRIGDLAKATDKTQRALRLYEELGLLTCGERTSGGFRLYGPEAIDRVHWIGKLQELG
ncbi:MAG TPA: MerR family transcriptional regulator, partial [Myxococcota bacterium]